MMRATVNPETTVRVSRTIRAPLHRIFDAFTHMNQLSKWWGPFPGGKGETHELIFEPKVHGEFHWVYSDFEGHLHTINGEIYEIVPKEKIFLTWVAAVGTPHFDHEDHHHRDGRRRHLDELDVEESRINIDFREGQGVEIRVLQTDLPDSDVRDAAIQGWNAALERLEAFLKGG